MGSRIARRPRGFWDRVLTTVGRDGRCLPAAHGRAAGRADRRSIHVERGAGPPWFAAAAAIVIGVVAIIAVPHRSSVTPDVTAVVAQHGAQGSDAGDPVTMLAPVGPLAGFRR